MGYHEAFVYSEKYLAEEIVEQLLQAQKGIEPLYQEINIICKATTIKDIRATQMKVFGKTINIKPIKVHKGCNGIVVGCNNHKNPLELLPDFMKEEVNSRALDEILLNPKGMLDYKNFFEDSSIEVNGKTYFAKQNSDIDDLERDSIKSNVMEIKMKEKELEEKEL